MRLLKRIFAGLGLALASLIALLAASIIVDGWVGRGRLDSLANVQIPNPAGPDVRAFAAKPNAPGPHPAVIMVHEFWGLNADIVGKAQALAQEGFVVVAPDAFRGSTTGWIPRAIYQVVSTPPQQIDSDVHAVFEWLARQPEVRPNQIGIMGFCFGGGTSIRYSVSNSRLAATVVFYGTPVTDPQKLKGVSGPVLGIFGGADNSIPLSEVRAFEEGLRQANVPHKISVYEGQPHAFVTSIESVRQGGPPQQAWNEMLAFFKLNLQGPGATLREASPQVDATVPTWNYLLQLALGHLGTHGH